MKISKPGSARRTQGFNFSVLRGNSPKSSILKRKFKQFHENKVTEVWSLTIGNNTPHVIVTSLCAGKVVNFEIFPQDIRIIESQPGLNWKGP